MNATDIIDATTVPLRDAAHEARQVLARTLVDEDGKIDFPIDLEHIAEALGISILYAPLAKDVAGAISKNEGQVEAEAVINEEDIPTRQRFTIAHEIGHFVKHAREDGLEAPTGFVDKRNELSSTGTDREEVFANQFAAELLAPAFAVRHFWAQGLDSQALRKIFDISQASMDFRLSTLRLA